MQHAGTAARRDGSKLRYSVSDRRVADLVVLAGGALGTGGAILRSPWLTAAGVRGLWSKPITWAPRLTSSVA